MSKQLTESVHFSSKSPLSSYKDSHMSMMHFKKMYIFSSMPSLSRAGFSAPHIMSLFYFWTDDHHFT